MSRSYGVVFLWAVAMAGGLWLIATRVSVHSELGDLLPEGTTATQRILLTQVRSGVTGRLLLLAIEGGTPDELARASQDLAARLHSSEHFDMVRNGAQALTSRERDIIFRSRYLLSRLIGADSFSAESLRRALEQRLDDLRSPLAPIVKPTVAGDPTGEFLGILTAWSAQAEPAKHRGVWMSKDRSKALLVAETKAAGFD